MQAFQSNIFTSTSNVSVQLVVLNQWPSTKRFHFNFLMEKPILYESEQGGLPQEGARRPVGTYQIVWIGAIHGHSLNGG